ncbi:MAG: hypothetical protein GXY14_11415 [Spirochaetes bacterium]|nr:hypothetical protein [Spirochaetota bacterium]
MNLTGSHAEAQSDAVSLSNWAQREGNAAESSLTGMNYRPGAKTPG